MDPRHLLEAFGTAGLFAIVFAETGLLIGFFLPGDSLLVLAGLFSAVRHPPVPLSLPIVVAGCFVAAVAGAQTGYVIGARVGPALFRRPESRLFKKEHVDKAQSYFDRHGPKTILIARFVPIVRTFANPMAGVARMDVRRFAVFNVAGALLWAVGVTLLGWLLGKRVPRAQDHLAIIEAIIIAASLVPVAFEVVRSRRAGSTRRSSARARP